MARVQRGASTGIRPAPWAQEAAFRWAPGVRAWASQQRSACTAFHDCLLYGCACLTPHPQCYTGPEMQLFGWGSPATSDGLPLTSASLPVRAMICTPSSTCCSLGMASMRGSHTHAVVSRQHLGGRPSTLRRQRHVGRHAQLAPGTLGALQEAPPMRSQLLPLMHTSILLGLLSLLALIWVSASAFLRRMRLLRRSSPTGSPTTHPC